MSTLRERFETWADMEDFPLTPARDGYRNEATDAAWEAWQAGYRLALDEAAMECSVKWSAGYRGDVDVGFAYVVCALRSQLDQSEG